MAVQSKLLVDGVYYNLKSFDYGFIKDADDQGLAFGKTRQAGITCEIEAVREEVFEEWAFSDFMKKYVEIHMIHTVTGMGKSRILKCHDTFLLGLNCSYRSTTEQPMTFHLYMKSGAIESSASTAAHVEQWSQLPDNSVETTVIEKLEPMFLGYRFEDGEGNEIDQYNLKPNQKVLLIIETENADGDTIDLNLNDNRLDYKYNGITATNDIVKGIQVTGDETTIELTTVEEGA